MVFAVQEQDPSEIEFFEFTLPGSYEQKVIKGKLVFEKNEDGSDDESRPVYDTRKPQIYRLPLMQYLGVDQVALVEDGGSLVELLQVFGPAANAMRRLNGSQMGSLMRAWREASSLGLGESLGSGSSSGATDRN